MSSANAYSTPSRSITSNRIAELLRDADGSFRADASWSEFSSLGTGTASFFLISLRSLSNTEQWIPRFRNAGFSVVPLGAGTNFAGSDNPLEHTVFLKGADGPFRSLRKESGGMIRAGSALSLRNVLSFAKDAGLTGMSGLSGIPGTLGGALFMNAGANNVCISDFLMELELLDLCTGKTSVHLKSDFPWDYRSSGLSADSFVVSALLHFPSGDASLETELWEKERLRRAKAPRGRSAGSVFRNPAGGPAGKFLEAAGLKGMRSGAFAVSEAHANWIVNTGDGEAREADFLRLVHEMKREVYRTASIILQTEVRFANMNSENGSIRVLVVMGGVSSERGISLKSGKNVADALRAAGFDVREYDIHDLALTDDMRNWADVIFPVLHGGYGEDGRFQKLLEDASLRFVGPSSRACGNIMNKTGSKNLMREKGIATAAFRVVRSADEPIPEGFTPPVIVKPNSNGSTFGVTLVETPEQWHDALEEAFRFDDSVLVEEYIRGIEGSVGVVAGKTLPIVEIQFPGKIYDYDAKYNAQSKCRHICPPETMTAEMQADVAKTALAFAEAVGAAQLVRVDVIVRNSDHKVFVLEGNGLPGMTDTSMLPQEARTAGISMPELCSALVRSAFER